MPVQIKRVVARRRRPPAHCRLTQISRHQDMGPWTIGVTEGAGGGPHRPRTSLAVVGMRAFGVVLVLIAIGSGGVCA